MNELLIARGLNLEPLWKDLCRRFRADQISLKLLPPPDEDGLPRQARVELDAGALIARLDQVVGRENWSMEYYIWSDDLCSCRLTVFGATRDALARSGSAAYATPDAFRLAAGRFGIGRRLYDHIVAVEVDANGQIAHPEEVYRKLRREGRLQS
jgi:hypothetical protein